MRVHGVRAGDAHELSEADGDDRPVPQTPSRVDSHVAPTDEGFIGYKDRRLLSILNKQKLERVLAYMLDENEFLGPHGIRSLSRYHLDHPFVFHVGGQEYKVQYLPGGIEYRHVRRQLQLAGAGLDAGQCADRPGAVEPVSPSTATNSRCSARPVPGGT